MNSKELVNKIHDLLIIREDSGNYHLFGKYYITNNHEYFTVNIKDEIEEYDFATLQHAFTWCVFAKNKKHKDIKRIQELDNELSSLNVAIEQHKKLVIKNTENKWIYLAKLNEEKLKRKLLLEEIKSYITISKIWQSKKFEENKG